MVDDGALATTCTCFSGEHVISLSLSLFYFFMKKKFSNINNKHDCRNEEKSTCLNVNPHVEWKKNNG